MSETEETDGGAPELRFDRSLATWVVVAPGRLARPHEPDVGDGPAPVCPFCPGAGEDRQTPELWRLGDDGTGWRVRVVANKFPMLTPDRNPARQRRGGFVAMGGRGHHEVVIESPDHGWDPATAAPAEVTDVLTAWSARHRALRDDAALVVVFRNHRAASGTSLEHPHSQIVATPVVPPLTRQRFDVARRYFDEQGGCLYVEMAADELADGTRLVAATESYVAFVPYAAAAAFETWIVPRTHRASFAQVPVAELPALAAILCAVLAALRSSLGDLAYNLVVNSAPAEDEDTPYFLWHLRIVPRLSIPAGFELATGMSVNQIGSEHAAAVLRAASRLASPTT